MSVWFYYHLNSFVQFNMLVLRTEKFSYKKKLSHNSLKRLFTNHTRLLIIERVGFGLCLSGISTGTTDWWKAPVVVSYWWKKAIGASGRYRILSSILYTQREKLAVPFIGEKESNGF